ncbi:FAD-dependent oxidoreductase [Gordonia sp. NPDC003376]
MTSSDVTDEETLRVTNCDVCIVGAGIAGLNALFVASRYLSQDQKIVLIDRRERVGGMWIDAYPYLRLHQPHQLFTAGNIPWTLGRDRSYLATNGEVLDHLAHCLSVIEQRAHVEALFDHDMESADEVDGVVRVACRSTDGRRQLVQAKRLIKAYGLRVTPMDPLELSSTRVRSVSPNSCDLLGDEVRADDAPVWIIGGGKTAMDTAHLLITANPGREVNLVAGSGTMFGNRDILFPTGSRRWWGGSLVSSLALESTRRFDGTNETEIWNWIRSTYGTAVTPTTGNFLFANLSESERTTIIGGLTDVIMDRLVDVVDRGGTTELVLRNGSTIAIGPGSWIVNCTGYLLREDHPYEPYVSAGGKVISIQPRSATLHLTSFMGYFLSHLLFSDKISEVPLYELDLPDLQAKSKIALPVTMFTLAQHNLGLIADNVPVKVFADCGLDFDRWYPLPRRMIAAARFMLTHRHDREHFRTTLDTVRERFDVRCGPLSFV